MFPNGNTKSADFIIVLIFPNNHIMNNKHYLITKSNTFYKNDCY